MNTRKISKAALFTMPLVVVLACSSGSSDGEESSGKKEAGSEAKGAVGNWEILTKKPEFKKEYGMFGSVKLKVKNVSDSEDEPWLEIRLTNKKGDLVTTFDCIGDSIEPDQSTVLDCTSLDDYAPFTDYEIKNAF